MSFRNVRKYFSDAHDERGRQVAWAEVRRGSDPVNDWAGEWNLPGYSAVAKECRKRVDAMVAEAEGP